MPKKKCSPIIETIVVYQEGNQLPKKCYSEVVTSYPQVWNYSHSDFMLKELRNEHGYLQDQLANELEVSRQTIISIEKGKYNPSLPLALQIAKKFNTHIEDIFFLEEKDHK